MCSTNAQQAERLTSSLAALGFSRVQGASSWRHNGVSFATDGAWGVLSTATDGDVDPLALQWGQPGLWKVVIRTADCRSLIGDCGLRAEIRSPKPEMAHSRRKRQNRGQEHSGAADGVSGFRRVFELPLTVVAEAEMAEGDDDDGRRVSLLEAALAWGLATLDGVPNGWQLPPAQAVAECVPPGSLTVRCGPHARQGRVVAGEGRLALRMPVLSCLPAGLSECRMSWLRQVLLDAQDRWRLVRMAPVADGWTGPVEAEVDLTGAPPSLLEGLVPVAASALRYAVAWVVGPCAFLAHAVQEPRALAMCLAEEAPGAPSSDQA